MNKLFVEAHVCREGDNRIGMPRIHPATDSDGKPGVFVEEPSKSFVLRDTIRYKFGRRYESIIGKDIIIVQLDDSIFSRSINLDIYYDNGWEAVLLTPIISNGLTIDAKIGPNYKSSAKMIVGEAVSVDAGVNIYLSGRYGYIKLTNNYLDHHWGGFNNNVNWDKMRDLLK